MSLFIEMYDTIAKRKLGIPEDAAWSVYLMEWMSDRKNMVVQGSNYRIKKSGPDKGGRKWTKENDQKTIISTQELDEYQANWEATNRKCFQCSGSGQKTFSWSKSEGEKQRPCWYCDGTGKPFQKKNLPIKEVVR